MRFACGLGAVWLLVTIWAFSTGLIVAAYGLGLSMTGVALLVGTAWHLPRSVY